MSEPTQIQNHEPKQKVPSPGRAPLLSESYVPAVMDRCLTTRDLAGVFVLVLLFVSNVPNATSAGAATFFYWVLGGLTFFLPCILTTAQLSILFPSGGGLYGWTYHALGRSASFFVGLCAWFPGLPLVVSTPAILVSLIQGLNPTWLREPWQQGGVIMAVICRVPAIINTAIRRGTQPNGHTTKDVYA